MQVTSMAACLPEQFWASADGRRPARRQASRSSSSSGKSRVFCRSSGPSPAPARIRRTPSRWKRSPEWLEAARASSGGSSRSPACSMATSCSGLADERTNTGRSGCPAAATGRPAASRPTASPWWTPSTNSERISRARTAWLTQAAYVDRAGGSHLLGADLPVERVDRLTEPVLNHFARGVVHRALGVAAGDLLGEQVDDALHPAPGPAHPGLDVLQVGDRLAELDVGHRRVVRAADVGHGPLRLPPVLPHPARLGGHVPAHPVVLTVIV